MPALIVSAVAETNLAAPDGRLPVNIVVSVNLGNQTGDPVGGLLAANFTLKTARVAPYGAAVDVLSVRMISPGFYIIEIRPVEVYTWKAGQYIYTLAVKQSSSQGQTVVSAFID